MPLPIRIKPPLGLAGLQEIVGQLATGKSPSSAETMAQLLSSAFALRHAAHLERAFAPWLPTLAQAERSVTEALLGKLTVESAEEGDGRIDDHGGYRGELRYQLIGSARVVGLHHDYGYNNSEMYTSTSLSFEDRGPSPALKKAGKKAPKKLKSERLALDAPTDLSPAAEMLFSFLGPEAALSRETRIRFLLRLLFPWGRYLHGYDGVDDAFYKDADHLFSLTRARRASALKARQDDGEIIPFFLG